MRTKGIFQTDGSNFLGVWHILSLSFKMEAHYCKIKITRDGKVVVTSKMLHFVKPQQNLPKFGSHSHTTVLWPMEQSSILSGKFDCPVARQNLSLLATGHDSETCLFGIYSESGKVKMKDMKSRRFFFLIKI